MMMQLLLFASVRRDYCSLVNDIEANICKLFHLVLDTPSANCSDGDTRLQDGTSNLATGVMEGRLEICINEAWGSVCTDHFGSAEAAVVCNSFNLTGRGGWHTYQLAGPIY